MMNSVAPFSPRLFPLRLPRVCVAVIGSDPNEMAEKAEALARDNSFLELRLDYLSKPGLAIQRVKRFMEAHHGTTVIATCRRVAGGGKFRGSIASQLDILNKAAGAGCQLVDVELQTAAKSKPEQLHKLRSRAGLILSYHDFRATKKLDETLEKMLAYPADFYKVVSTATTLADNVAMIKFLTREGDRHSMVSMCMGEQGIISRVLEYVPAVCSPSPPPVPERRPPPARSRRRNCAMSTALNKSTLPRGFMRSSAIPLHIRSPLRS